MYLHMSLFFCTFAAHWYDYRCPQGKEIENKQNMTTLTDEQRKAQMASMKSLEEDMPLIGYKNK